MHVFEGWKKTGKLEDLVTELLGNLKPGVDLHKRRMSAEVLVAMSSEEFAKELVLRSISMLSQPHKTNVAMSLSAMGLLSDELKEALEGKFSRIKMKEQHA